MRTLEQIWRDWIDNPQYREKQDQIYDELMKHKQSFLRDKIANLVMEEEVLNDFKLLCDITKEKVTQKDIDDILNSCSGFEEKSLTKEKAKYYLDGFKLITETTQFLQYLLNKNKTSFRIPKKLQGLIDFFLKPEKRLKFILTNKNYCLYLINQKIIELHHNFIKQLYRNLDDIHLKKLNLYRELSKKSVLFIEELYDNHKETFEDYYLLLGISDFNKYFKTLSLKDYNDIEKKEHKKYIQKIIDNFNPSFNKVEIMDAIKRLTD